MKNLQNSWFFRISVVIVILGIAGLVMYLTRTKDDLSSVNGIFDAITRRAEKAVDGLHTSRGDDWTAQMTDGLPLEVEGYAFKVNSQAGNTIAYTLGDATNVSSYTANQETQDINAVMPIIQEVMRRANYSQAETVNGFRFIKDGVECIATTPEYGALTLSCSDPLGVAGLAAHAKPFVDTYLAANTSLDAADVAIGPVVVKDQSHESHVYKASRSSGYSIGEALMTTRGTKTLALFYKKDGGNWKYVAEATDEYGFRCGEFEKDPDARKAFYDQVCLGAEGHIRLDTDNRALQ